MREWSQNEQKFERWITGERAGWAELEVGVFRPGFSTGGTDGAWPSALSTQKYNIYLSISPPPLRSLSIHLGAAFEYRFFSHSAFIELHTVDP